MRKEARKRAIEPVMRTPEQLEGIDPKSEIKGTFSTTEAYTAPLVNPNDKRDQSQPQNFGIIPGMSFSEAFAQAGKGVPELGVPGAKAGESTFFWTDPDLEKNPEQKVRNIIYDFKKEEKKPTLKDHLKNITSENPNATAEELVDILRTAKNEYSQK